MYKDLNSHCLYKGSYVKGANARPADRKRSITFILCSPYTSFILITGYGLLFDFKAGVVDSGRHVVWRLNC